MTAGASAISCARVWGQDQTEEEGRPCADAVVEAVSEENGFSALMDHTSCLTCDVVTSAGSSLLRP